MIDFDLLLEELGGFAVYQIIVMVSLVYFQIPGAMNSIASVFISYVPDHRCQMPFDDPTLFNLTDEQILNLTTPLDKNGHPIEACERYGYNITECTIQEDTSCVNMSESLVGCDNGYYYDDSLFTETTVTEFDLVCDRRTVNSVTTTMYMVGVVVGAPLFGNISDRFGRKLTIIVTGIGLLISMLGTAYSYMVEVFIFWRFLTAVFVSGCNVGIFTHLMEIVGKGWRTFVGMSYQVGFSIGYMLWSGAAYLYRDWHQMELASLVLSAPFAIIVLIVPESPRWLFVHGRNKKGKTVTAIMERFNKVKIPESVWKEAEKSGTEKQEKFLWEVKYSTLDLFKYRRLGLVSLNVGFNWAVNGLVYFGIALNAGSLAGNIFLNNIYAAVLEIASYIFCMLTMDYIGRRLLLTITLIGSGVVLIASTIANVLAEEDATLITLGVALAFTAKALVSGSYAIIYNFTGKLFPTVVRSNGIGFGCLCARIGSIFSPFIIGIQDYVSWLPNTIFGVIAVIGGLSSLAFRDTTGRDMMETIEEAELFYAGKELQQKRRPSESELDADESKVFVTEEDRSDFTTSL